jgi:subtilisin-like proprotein convertase family protein
VVGAGSAAKQQEPGLAGAPAASTVLLGIEAVGTARTTDGVLRQYGSSTGVLRRYFRRAPGAGFKAPGPARQVADLFLVAHAAELGIDPTRVETDLQVRYVKDTPSGTHVRYDQRIDGVPVYRGEVVVKVGRAGDVSSVHNNLRLGLPQSLGKAGLTPDAAVERGRLAIAPRGRALGPFSAELYVVELEAGARLAYLVSVPVEDPLGDWLVCVDAQSGAVLGLEDRMLHVDGTGRVFDPDPLAVSGNPSLPDNDDADSGIPFPDAYATRTLRDITNDAGTYSLSGPYVAIQELESPISAPVTTTDPDAFLYTRSQQGFEDVNVYFHLDQSQRYIQDVLGIGNANNRAQPADPHGLSGQDNSHYVISTRILAFGEGGVDDAEDADVVLHEYGHAIQHDIVPGWGGGQEGQMGEGFGDYWAGSYSWSLFPSFQPNFVFNWDGHNAFWPGRVLVDSTKHYPEDCCGQVHASGTLWCSGLTTAMRAIGREAMDQLVIDHHFGLGTSATMADAANQILQSDIDLNGGANLQTLVEHFDFWGFVDASLFVPQIAHVPLTDTENTTGPYPVLATITSATPLDSTSLRLVWGAGGLTDTLQLLPTGPPGVFAAAIPGPLSDVTVHYYLTASDLNGGTATDPLGAPGAFHAFFVGGDTQVPQIQHTPLADQAELGWPVSVMATITDNLGVDDAGVSVEWWRNGAAQATFGLGRVGVTDVFAGTFPSDTTLVAVGDSIAYVVQAQDTALVPNIATHPATGTHAFAIIDALGTVLILDDDDVPRGAATKRGEVGKGRPPVQETSPARDPASVSLAAHEMQSILEALSYVTTLEPASSSNPATWPAYSFIVASSGGNPAPVESASYRAALESYVAAGGKLIVEGGEVAYAAASSPGYPTFAANVLHTNDWDADNAGTLQHLGAQADHPLATTPNVLPATMSIAYTGFGSQDSYKPTAPAVIVYGVTAQPGNGGILVYDDSPAPQAGQIVYFGFDFKDLADAPTRAALLENAAAYLLAHEPGPTGSISGTVNVAGDADDSGVTVTLTPSGAQVVTGAAGTYAFGALFPATYTVTASKEGFATAVADSVPVSEQTNTGDVNLTLYPQPSVTQCISPGLAIPDNSPAGITSQLVLPDSFTVQDVRVQVNITHTYIGDLTVELEHGTTTVRLHNATGSSSDDIVGTYPTTLAVDGPGTLADFNGVPASGSWSLRVIDAAAADVGTLNTWCITVLGPVDSSVVTNTPLGLDLPSATLFSGSPNPAFGGAMVIAYALPAALPVELSIYDVAGRLVRTLVRGRVPAGMHSARWDGLDAARQPVAAGVYFTRLRAAKTHTTRKVVVLR